MSATMAATGKPVRPSTATLTKILRSVWRSCTAKRAAAAADVSYRTVEDWLQGRSEPNASVLLAWAHHREFRAELKDLLEEIDFAERRLEDRLGVERRLAEANGQGTFDFGPAATDRRPTDREARPAAARAHPARRAA